jgi:hypothetical protein
MQPRGLQITCPNCRQPFSAILEQVIDVQRDPQAKARLLAGRTNLVTCPHCGYQSMVSTPLVYHDANKELLLIYVPMELNLPRQEQERLIGSMSNAIISGLPQEQRKGYLLTPKTMLSLQGMIELILEKDGITKEVIEAQRAKMRLVETFLQTDPDTLPELVQQNDNKIDEEFFAIMAATAEAALANGRRDVAEQTLMLRERLLELSTVGQDLLRRANAQEAAIQEVADALNALGERASYDDLVNVALQFAGDDEKLQVLVGLTRQTFDYEFFQNLAKRIDQAKGDERATIVALRDRLLELTSMVDQQNEAVIKQAADTLRAIANSPDLDTAIMERLEILDDTFLAVLSANIQAAEQAKDVDTAARLKTIFEKVVGILQEAAPPAIKFINELMQQPDLDAARSTLQSRAQEFGPELIQWMDMLSQDLAARGNEAAIQKLAQLREVAMQTLAVEGMNQDGGRPSATSQARDEASAGRPQLIVPPSRKSSRRS